MGALTVLMLTLTPLMGAGAAAYRARNHRPGAKSATSLRAPYAESGTDTCGLHVMQPLLGFAVVRQHQSLPGTS
eukprot:3306897-Rhodomonas_salina.2